MDVVEVVFEVGAALAHGFEVEPDGFEEAFFEVAVAGAAAAEVGFEGVDVGFGGDEFEEIDDETGVGVFGFFDWGGVGFDAHDFFAEGFFGFEDGDGVVVAFAHFFAIEAGDFGDIFFDAGFGEAEGFAEGVIEFGGDVAGDFDVLFLVLADGDEVTVVDEDVCGHEDGVGEEPVIGGEAASGFVFVAVAVFEHGHGRQGAEDPCEFTDFGDVALAEEGGFGGVEAAGEEVEGEVEDVGAEGFGVLETGERVVVGDEVEGVAFVLEGDGGLHHAEVVAEVQTAGGLDA